MWRPADRSQLIQSVPQCEASMEELRRKSARFQLGGVSQYELLVLYGS
jgi:hypothetical protein